MSSLPAPEKVAGAFLPQYEVYYKRLDPEGKCEIGAMAAAGFLKKSGLPDDVLGKIWDLSDPGGKGFLDKSGLFVACKMVALVQSDIPLTIDNAFLDAQTVPAPFFGPETAPGAPTAKQGPADPQTVLEQKKHASESINFLVKPEEKRKYDALFDQLQPADEKLGGDKVRQVMMGSKLSTAHLGKIWDLADIDRDGMLTRYEFTVAMHLTYRALQGDKLPSQLPPELFEDKVPKPLSSLPNFASSAPKPPAASPQPGGIEAVPWVVNKGERLRFYSLFKQTDTDNNGFVSGVEIKNLFLQTGLPQNILAHIWNLCDMNQEGKLNPEQFALAMWLVQQKQAGKDPPAALTPDMVPPSLRSKALQQGSATIYNNPELEMLAKEIQALLSEKLSLEKELQDSEYQISLKTTECLSLQSEFDTLASTLKQLTNQKEVAQKRLDDLDSQNNEINDEIQKVSNDVNDEQLKVEKLRQQADDQETTLVAQEKEVNGKKEALESLKNEEKSLLEEIRKAERDLEKLEQNLNFAQEMRRDTVAQNRELTDGLAHMEEALQQFRAADESGADSSSITDNYLEPLNLSFVLPDLSKLEKPAKPPLPEPPHINGSMSDSDPFGGGLSPGGALGGPARTPEWGNNDAFAAAFDGPFGYGSNGVNSNQDGSFFGNDEAPPVMPRPDSGDSPTPALPPKSAAPPPKRPPPPRRPPPPSSGSSRGAPGPPLPPPPNVSSPDDPFGNARDIGQSDNGFANFANFDGFSNSQFNTFSFSSQAKSGGLFDSDGDSAFGSGDPTPSHKPRYGQTIEFDEDPFKNVNHRYGDPFELAGSDPFLEKEDPFTAPVTAAFGRTSDAVTPAGLAFNDPFNSSSSSKDPFASSLAWPNPSKAFSTPGSDPFAPISSPGENLDESFDPFSSRKFKESSQKSSDPFGGDPFAPVPSASKPSPSTGFGFGSGAHGFDAFESSFSNNTPIIPPPNKTLPNDRSQKRKEIYTPKPQPENSSKAKSSVSLSRTWRGDSDDFFESPSLTPKSVKTSTGKSKPKSVTPTAGMFSEFLHPGSTSNSKSQNPSDRKKKSFFNSPLSLGRKSSRHDKSKSAADLTNLGPSAPAFEEFQNQFVGDPPRQESERMRRLREQEEADLAYAIALSKAEAASLNKL